MAFAPITGIAPQYEDNSNWWLKFYVPGTSTPKAMSIDEAGSTLLAKAQLDAEGFPTTDGSTIFIPFIEDRYDLFLFPTEAEADANDTINAIRLAENITPAGGFTVVISKLAIAVIEDQLIYAYPANVVNVSAIIVSGKVLMETAGDYINDSTAKTITLSEGLATEDTMEWWTSSIPAPAPVTSGGLSESLAFFSSATSLDLTGVDVFTTQDGLVAGDNFGGTFAATGLTNVGSASTADIISAKVYDVNGLEFKFVGEKIRLETLGVTYTETSTIVLGYIIALRGNGFSVDVSEKYTLSDHNSQINIYNNQREIIVHRCFQDQAPQGTLLALSLIAISTPGQNIGIEFDVQITDDGIPVVFHDLSIDALTDGTGVVTSLTLAQLKAVQFTEIIGTAFEGVGGVTIPTLDEFIRDIAAYGFKAYPEIKAYRTVADIKIMDDVIGKYRYRNATIWQSFNISDLEKLRENNQQSGTAWATETGFTQTDLDDLSALGGDVSIIQSINTWINNPSDIDIFNSYGFASIPFTADRIESYYDLTDLGMQKVITDTNFLPNAGMTVITSPCRLNLNPWAEIKSGSATVVYTANPENDQTVGEIASVEAAANEDARIRFPFNITAGEIIKMSVFARNIGTHADDAQIDIDRDFGTRKNTINIRSTDWKLYEISYTAPFNETFAAYQGGFELGSSFTRDSGAAFYRPTIYSSNSGYGTKRTIMDGYLTIGAGGAGTMSLDVGTYSNNIDIELSVFNGFDIDIRPQREVQLIADVFNQFPTCTLTHSENGQDTVPLDFKADSKFSTGNLRISAFQAGTSTKFDLSTLATEHRIYFEVKM